MRVIYGLKGIRRYRRPVVALGVFDGVHRGHRLILEEAIRQARKVKGTSIVLTFWPHPQRQKSIYSLEHRLKLIQEIGIDVCIVIRFGKKFSKISAQSFIREILFKRLGAGYVYIGKNFSFGKGASGNFITLKKLSSLYNFKLKVFNVIKINNQPISSTYIRALIIEGHLRQAQRLLAHPVSILGTVIKGESIGKRLGFPTANIQAHHEVLPPSGIYAVDVILNNRKLKGACYIGSRPTFKTGRTRYIEVYIFRLTKNIYGKYLEIRFIKKIRGDRKFSSAKSLIKQIKKDINTAQRISSCL